MEDRCAREPTDRKKSETISDKQHLEGGIRHIAGGFGCREQPRLAAIFLVGLFRTRAYACGALI